MAGAGHGLGGRLRHRDRIYLRLLSRALSGPAQARLPERRGAPPIGRPLSYLELGYGQGLSINIHAAANDGTFWGTDFNPVQTAHAMAFAEASGANVGLLNASFAELAARTDLPEFDVIALHGIWTWISEENSRHIVDIIRRKLRVGGIVYISYNCFPGWAPAAPLRHLMKLHADLAGAEASGMVAKVEAAMDFARQVVDFRGTLLPRQPRRRGVPEEDRVAELQLRRARIFQQGLAHQLVLGYGRDPRTAPSCPSSPRHICSTISRS